MSDDDADCDVASIVLCGTNQARVEVARDVDLDVASSTRSKLEG